MPRTSEQNRKIREETRNRILGAALGLYVRFGYNGTDMDKVAAEAGVAKGLLYYYFKNKNIMFRELFDVTVKDISSASESFFNKTMGMKPLERLLRYSLDICGLGSSSPHLIRFAMRMPFDAYGIFGEEGWQEGMKGSEIHTKNLSRIIVDGMAVGVFSCSDATAAAGAFWTVFVSGLFSFIGLMGDKDRNEISSSDLRNLLEFGMRGLGAEEDNWMSCLGKVMTEAVNESV